MLNSIKMNFSRVRYILDTDTFKMVFLAVLFMCFFSLFNIASDASYTEGLFIYINSKTFLFPLICIIFVSSCIFLFAFDKDYSTLLRFDTKANYLKKLVISLSIGNFIIYSLAIIMGILFVTLKYFGAMTFSNVEYYNISYVVYIIFAVIKLFVIIDLLALIGICIYKNLGKIGAYFYYTAVLIFYYYSSVSLNVISHFTLKSLNLSYYLSESIYTSFGLEIAHTIIFICILILALFLLIYVLIRFNKVKIDG